MRYCCTLLAVSDIEKSRNFYEILFGFKVSQDFGKNILFSCGLALQQDFDWLTGIPKHQVQKKPNNVELVFETHDFDMFLQKLSGYPGTEVLSDVVTHDWGQRVIRFYDPDGHLIEVGEEMKLVIDRFISEGMTLEEIAAKIYTSIDVVSAIMKGNAD